MTCSLDYCVQEEQDAREIDVESRRGLGELFSLKLVKIQFPWKGKLEYTGQQRAIGAV